MRAARLAAALVAALAVASGLASTAVAAPCAGSGYYATSGSIQRFATTTNAATGDPLTAAGIVGGAVTPDGSLLYALDGTGDQVLVFDTATAARTATVPLDHPPTDVAFAPDGTTAYVANGAAITVIAVASSTVTATLAPGIAVQRLAVATDGTTLYASAADGVHVHAAGAWSTVGPANAGDLALSPDGETLYVVGTDSVTPIATATAVPGAPFTATGATTLAVAPDGTAVYVGTGTGAILARRAGGTTVIATAATSIAALDLRPDGTALYAATAAGVLALRPTGVVLGTLGSSAIDALAVCPATVPGAPTAVEGDPGDTTVEVSWTAPGSDGGASITGYAVTASPGGATCTTTGARTCTVSGLRNATAYTFVVVARNVAGDSAASAASARVTPRRDNRARTLTIGTPRVVFGRRSVTLLLDVAATGPGVIALVAKRRAVRACAASRRVRAAGVYRLRCRLTTSSRALARRRATDYTLLATFSPTFGPVANARTSATVPRRR